jgi:UPF0716 protein FxsA
MPALLFVLYVVAEIGAFVLAVNTFGALRTVLLLIAGSAVGLLLVRSQWRHVMDGLRKAANGERSPGGAVADGALVALGAFLMFVPGLVTSVLGLLLLLPPTRFLVRPVVVFLAARRFGPLTINRPAGAGTIIDGDIEGEWYDPQPTSGQLAIEGPYRAD